MELVYSHRDFYVVDKPAGASFHSESGVGFFQSACDYFDETLFPVHRLDKVTSGLIIFARNKDAAAKFGQLFNEHKDIDKFYVAIGKGKPKKKQGEIKGDMEKTRGGSYKLVTTTVNPAVTRFYTALITPGVRAYLLKAVTGKTHQLRVALKANATPILGDTRYKADEADRVYLHAFALRFDWHGVEVALVRSPSQGELFNSFEFKQLVSDWQMPWQLKW